MLPDIEDLPPTVQEKLFDEVLDRDVQKGDLSITVFTTRLGRYDGITVYQGI